jgi:hypothetical protein
MKSIYLILLILIALALFIVLAFYFISGDPLFDFTAFWIAGSLTLNGQDPYLVSDWVPVYSQFPSLGLADNQTFLYPKPILLLFLPFGALPLQTAAFIWLILTQIAVLSAVLLLATFWPVDKRGKYLAPILIAILIFRPYLLTLNLGQLGGFFLLILTAAMLLWRRLNWLAAGILLSLIALKPQLGLPILALVSLWFLFKKIWMHFLGLGIGGISLFILGWVFDPNWVGKFLQIGTNKVSVTFGHHPTFWGLSGYLCHRQQSCTMISGITVSAVFLAMFLILLWVKRNHLSLPEILALSIPLALMLTPYLWAYDQLLLIVPTMVTISILIQKNYPYLLITVVPFVITVSATIFLNIAIQIDNDTWSAIVPLISFIILSVSLLIPPKEPNNQKSS